MVKFFYSLPLLFLTLLVSGCSYETEPHTSTRYTGGVWNAEKTAFVFFRSYHLFLKPKGLSRFPDGGQSRTLHQSASLYLFDNKKKELRKVDRIPWENDRRSINSWLSSGVTHLQWEGNTVVYGYQKYNVKEFRYEPVVAFSLDADGTGKKLRDPASLPVDLKKKRFDLSVDSVEKKTVSFDFPEWGIPSPLVFCQKKSRVYISDILRLRGDRSYRAAVLQKLDKTLSMKKKREFREDFLASMEKLKKENSLKHAKYLFSIEQIFQELTKMVEPSS